MKKRITFLLAIATALALCSMNVFAFDSTSENLPDAQFDFVGTKIISTEDGLFQEMDTYVVTAAVDEYVVQEDGVRIRTAPNTTSGILGLLYTGDLFYVATGATTTNGFFYGQADSNSNAPNMVGWVYSDYLCYGYVARCWDVVH